MRGTRSTLHRPAGRTPATALLRIRNFRLYLTGAMVAWTGVWMFRVATAWLVLQMTDSGAALGAVMALMYLPLLVVGPWGGVLADRYPKRSILCWTQTSMGGSAAAVGILEITGVVALWHVLLCVFLFGLSSAIDQPTRLSFVGEMVGAESLSNAVALNSTMVNVARLLGPAVGGLLIDAVGAGWVIVLYALSVGAVIVALALMRPEELHLAERTARGRGQFRAGIRYVTASRELRATFVLVGLVGTFGYTVETTLPLMATRTFDGEASLVGVLNSLLAVGSLGGAALATRRGAPRPVFLLGSAASFGLVSVVAALMPTTLLFGVVLVPLGFSLLTYFTASNALVQLAAEPAMRGRVMALYMTTMLGGAPLGAPVIGLVSDGLSPRVGMAASGAISIGAAVLGAIHFAGGARRGVRGSPSPTVQPGPPAMQSGEDTVAITI
jgi:MFS family permease